jgi:DNA-binding transcriptional ArsR family regulator
MSAAVADATFAAIADPTRRHLIESLARGPATATRLAAALPITRQAVAKHLGLLREADLVDSDRVGRETVYTLQPEGLRGVAEWSARVGREWDERLAKLNAVVAD